MADKTLDAGRAIDTGRSIGRTIESGQDFSNFFRRMDDVSDFGRFKSGGFRENLMKLTGRSVFKGDRSVEAHHVFPKKYQPAFQNAIDGPINIHDPKYGAWVDAKLHRQWSTAYNAEWKEFFRYGPQPVSKIEDFGRSLGEKYGFTALF
jgi:hypothetical protein